MESNTQRYPETGTSDTDRSLEGNLESKRESDRESNRKSNFESNLHGNLGANRVSMPSKRWEGEQARRLHAATNEHSVENEDSSHQTLGHIEQAALNRGDVVPPTVGGGTCDISDADFERSIECAKTKVMQNLASGAIERHERNAEPNHHHMEDEAPAPVKSPLNAADSHDGMSRGSGEDSLHNER